MAEQPELPEDRHGCLNGETAERLLGGEPFAACCQDVFELARVLSAARSPSPVARRGEEAALGAFQAARCANPLPKWRRRSSLTAKVMLGVGLGGLVLGGVAVAGTTGALPTPFGTAHSARPALPGDLRSTPPAPVSPAPPWPTDRFPTQTLKDDRQTPKPPRSPSSEHPTSDPTLLARLCRTYLTHARKDHDGGTGLDLKELDRLVAAAGGPDAVSAFCANLLGPAAPDRKADPEHGATGGGGGEGPASNPGHTPEPTEQSAVPGAGQLRDEDTMEGPEDEAGGAGDTGGPQNPEDGAPGDGGQVSSGHDEAMSTGSGGDPAQDDHGPGPHPRDGDRQAPRLPRGHPHQDQG